jgi:hypothetical protein
LGGMRGCAGQLQELVLREAPYDLQQQGVKKGRGCESIAPDHRQLQAPPPPHLLLLTPSLLPACHVPCCPPSPPQDPPFDDGSFAAGVTYDASPAAGSAPACIDNVRATWKVGGGGRGEGGGGREGGREGGR